MVKEQIPRDTDESCPNCKVDLSEYIDKCKIPCKSCRDLPEMSTRY